MDRVDSQLETGSMKHNPQPTNVGLLDLLQFRWPITALASISNRIAGIVLFMAIGLALYVLDASLASEESFAEIMKILASVPAKMASWVILTALAYHFLAGIKHLILDGGREHSFAMGSFAAKSIFVITAILSSLAGYWVL